MRFAAFAAVALAGSVAHAASPPAPFPVAPIYVTVTGSTPIRLRIWTGSVMPCDSGIAKLLDAKVQPGFSATYWTDAQSVCVEQTHEGFPDVGWSAPRIVFRNALCLQWSSPYGKYRRCLQWAAVPLHLPITTAKPG